MTQKTYSEILTFSTAARAYMERTKGRKTKLGYAIERVSKSYAAQADKLETAFRDKLEDLDIEHCSTDEAGNILLDGAGRYVFTKDAQRARLQGQKDARRALLESVVEVEPHFATDLPEDLTDAERAAMVGFTIREEIDAAIQSNGGGEVLEAGAAG
jgi:hypothetical protein